MKLVDKSMEKRHCGTAIIQMLIREQAGTKWYSSNTNPLKIGKMRKVVITFVHLKKPVFLTFTSTNSEAIEVTSPPVQMVKPPRDSFTFYMTPKAANKAVTVTVSVEYITSDGNGESPLSCKRTVLLCEWNLEVVGHLYESSKKGKLQSNNNKEELFVPILDPLVEASQTVFPAFVEPKKRVPALKKQKLSRSTLPTPDTDNKDELCVASDTSEEE